MPPPLAPRKSPSKRQRQCRVHAAARAVADAGQWWEATVLLDEHEGVGAGGDVDAVRAVVLLVLVAAQASAESRFASLGAEARVASAGTRRVLLERTMRRQRQRVREGMARSVLRAAALEELGRRRWWTKR